MKNSLLLILLSLAVSQAAVVRFNISPPGTDMAVGLSPMNEAPPVTNSTGSGDAISGGITFDTTSNTLTFAIGYGSAAGFADLTGPATALHIHGPAPVGQPVGVLFSLEPFHFPAADPAKGGIIFGTIVYTTNQISDLFASSNYVNIHTVTNPAGEIRGQLIPVLNAAPEVVCAPTSTVECGATATLTANVSDADGDALVVVWTLNGVALQTNNVAAGGPPTTGTVTFSGSLPLGTNEIAVTVTDSTSNSASCSTRLTVVDTVSPIISSVSATPKGLWPPNHKLLPVIVKAVVTDACGPTTWKIISVTSNEPVNGQGDGNTSVDWMITGDHTLKLRSERSGKGNGRIYTISIQATDASGNVSEVATVNVTVAHDKGHKRK